MDRTDAPWQPQCSLPNHWLAEYTSDLIDLLHVLGRLVALEPAQAQVLEDILGATLLEHEQLIAAGALGGTGGAAPAAASVQGQAWALRPR